MDWKKGIAVGIIGLVVGMAGAFTYTHFNPNIVEVAGENTVTEVPADYLTIGSVQYTIEDITDLQAELEEFDGIYTFDDKLADAYEAAEDYLKDELNYFDSEEYEIDEIEVDFKDKYTYDELKDGDYVFKFKGKLLYDDDEGKQSFEIEVKYDSSKDKYRFSIL